MKYKHLAFILAFASFSLPMFNGVAHADTATAPAAPATAVAPAAATPDAAATPAVSADPATASPGTGVLAAAVSEDGDELKMYRFTLQMDRLDFVKKAMALDADQEKKFLAVYYYFDAEMKALNDKRIAIIKDYAANFNGMTDAKANALVKSMFDFRKKRAALLEKFYPKVAKATSKIAAARFLQVESVLQGAADVTIGSSIPLMPK
jgi:hypothetical protein